MTDQNKAVLRLPLIGRFEKIKFLDAVGKIVELTGKDEENHKLLENLERALGYYLMDSGEYIKILDLLFPLTDDIKVEEIINGGNGEFPLFAKVFAGSEGEPDASSNFSEEKDRLSSAWSALMLELGEFELDERFGKLENEIKDLIKYFLKNHERPGEYSVLYAVFDENTEIIKYIWNRILGDDICLIFIDDNEDFDTRWVLKDIDKIVRDKSDSKKFQDYQVKNNNLWINPVKNNPKNRQDSLGYDNQLTKKEIIKIIKSKCSKDTEDKLPVLVIDLLYLDKHGINKIEGDNLIRELRQERDIKKPLIIGFTGGKSPFVINSAVKAGADIVIQKERGETIKILDSHGSGNPGGLFDLLWALSKNISRWCFLEKCKKYIHKEFSEGRGFYKPVLEPLFFSIENESPFWKEYLTNWLREIEDIRLKAIFENEPKKKENKSD